VEIERQRQRLLPLLLGTLGVSLCINACGQKDGQTTLTIATVNNGDMITMKTLSSDFERRNPNIRLNWVVLEENVLRQRVTTDIATGAGQFDVVTIGNYEVPIWAKRRWIKPIVGPDAQYDLDDLLKPVRDSVSYKGRVYAMPFYAESAMLYYRSDILNKAALIMPARPTYSQVAAIAGRLNDPKHQVYGMCLRGKPGWGENMALVTTMVHAFGGHWFDANWRPAIDTLEWRRAVGYYRDILRADGPPGATSNGFNENLALFASGHCAMWIDSTVAAGLLDDPKQSQVAGRVAYAPMPTGDDPGAPTWLWSWNLAIPAFSKHAEGASKFIAWATSRNYVRLVAQKEGWVAAPPGTRRSTYAAPEYRQAAPFSSFVLNAINSATPTGPAKVTRPYHGAQFVDIPEFQAIGSQVGQIIAATLTGRMSVEAALMQAQRDTEDTMRQRGSIPR
jgi:sorbitol/mannitol transport system substrate-binding protein